MVFKNYALVDMTFCSDNKNTVFVKSISITGIKESCKIFNKEFKYKYPAKYGLNNNIDKSNNVVFGNLLNKEVTTELEQIFKKIDIILTNGKIKTEFLQHFIVDSCSSSSDTKILDLSTFE